ncbi:MAG: heme exporter protein CcmB [Acidimicrobiia bacterium]
MRFWRQAWVIARRDLVSEGRSGEVVWVVIPFALVALFLIPVAIGGRRGILDEIGPGMFWVVVLLFGLFVTLRRSSQVSPAEADVLALVLVDPAAGFLGRSLASFVLVVGVQAVAAPATLALFGPELPRAWPWLVPIGLLAAAGMAMVGTIAGSLARGTRLGSAVAPLLAISLSFPLLSGASIATSELAGDADILAPVALLALVDVLVAVAGVLTARPLEESGA